ncbi:MAG: adenine phosphoribosyltransferase [Microbacteriaceae bacterium]|nr:adenine phosphoribosyltransferase [Microbacteriaceae bacterium]
MTADAAETVRARTRTVLGFPRPGVVFADLTPLIADGAALGVVADALLAPFAGRYDVIAGVEARGFVFGAAAAGRAGRGLVLIRKSGKLPGDTHGLDYELEYGTDRLEVHADQVAPGSRVLLVDDVLATGGTIEAAAALVELAGWRVAGVSVVLEIEALGGRARLAGHEVHAVVQR